MNPTSLNEVLGATVEVGEALARGAETRAKVAALRERLVRVEEMVSDRPRAGCLDWLDLPFSAGH